jgi:hydroxyacylglutathione hydrolase
MGRDAMSDSRRMLAWISGLTPREVQAAHQRGNLLLDLRRAADFVAEHPVGAVSAQFHRALLTFRVAQAIPPGTPLILMGQNDIIVEAAAYLLAAQRRNPLQGFLDGGLAAWKAAGLPTATCGAITAGALHERLAQDRDRPVVVDVREPFEWRNGIIAEAVRLRLGEVWERHGELPRDREVALVCMGGIRSCTAASILQRAGFPRVLNVVGGMDSWGRANLPMVK